ncbi:two-component system, sensor histidine kinase YesM [Cohnella sp. OV330]|uniref:sensor histidine kinase n=1 Tax=Cohnella sp. OV330 TaxID=1855288 RepID=UPI0008E538F5|nr:histidine kinase [Cohnella sp. OV330]SFA81975.1 two-component system, sensor histidine kinase YesM [Cohnella sp. OV330]
MGTFLKALTIYPKLVLSFLLMIIPIYLSSLLMNQSGHDVVKKQISASMASRVHFYLSSLETELARLRRLQMEYVSDDDLLSLGTAVSRMNDFERSRTILSVKSKLYLLKSSSPFVENVKLYVPALGRSIMANNYDDTIPEAELSAMLEPRNMSSPVFGFQDRLLLSGVYPDAIYVNRQPVLAIEIELSKAEIVRTLSSMANGEQGGAVWMSADGTWDVASGLQTTVLSELTGAIGTERADGRASAPGQFTMKTEAGSFFVAHEYSSVIDSTLAVLVPAEKVMQPLNRHRDWIWLLSLIALVLVVAFSYWIHQLIHKPIKRLVVSFRKVEKGDLGVRVYHRNQDEFHYLYNQFNHMLGRIETLIGEVYEQQIRSQRSELKQLQSQINPHFFYNSFFILQGLVQMREHELADKMFRHLGSYFQFITRNGAETVTLKQEMNHAGSYVEIQKFRFSGTIGVEQEELPAAWAQTLVPRLIVQPLIENAYLHGLENKTGDGRLRIGFREAPDGRLFIGIEDNGEELDDLRLERLRKSVSAADRAMETTGLLNIHRRLQLKFGPDCGLSLSRSALGGLKAELSIRKDKGDSA